MNSTEDYYRDLVDGYVNRIEELKKKLAVAREVLGNIHDICDEEIKERSAGLPESKLKNMKVLSLLVVPRNLAKSGLAEIVEGAE